MTNKKEIYKCEICGNIVEVLHSGVGKLVCCGKEMKLMVENSIEASKEKHVPIISGKIVKVGVVEHPMEEKHHIEWIEAECENRAEKIFLKPGEKPEAAFSFEVKKARAYCNLHGLWISK